MQIKKSYKIDQLRDYSSLFSRSEVNNWCKNDFRSLSTKVYRYDLNFFKHKTSYLSYLKHVYRILEKFYPNEYVYKNEFINKWIKNELGKSESVVYNEFRIGKAIADMVMFNGNSKVFEIKTLLDKDSRLSNQLLEYAKIFNEVYIIIPKAKIEKYINVDINIGIINYDELTGTFSLLRNSSKNELIDINTLMQVLHTNEYIQIVEQYFGFKPAFNDFNKFEVCKNLMNNIPHSFLNEQFIRLMKKRKINNNFSKEAKHLNQMFLSLNLSYSAKNALLNNLRTTIIN